MSYINALCAAAREIGMKCAPSLPRSLLVYPLASSQSAGWLQRDVRKEEPDVGKHEERTESPEHARPLDRGWLGAVRLHNSGSSMRH